VKSIGLVLMTVLVATPVFGAQARRPAGKAVEEGEFYKLITFDIPDGVVLEAGGIEVMPDKRVAVSTRRGDVYMLDGAFDEDPKNDKWTKWAGGMHEVLGLAYNPKDGSLYACQRAEVTRLKDTDGDGKCDVYETFCDGWGVSGDYHEYPFMSKFDKEGNLWIVLCLTGSFTSEAPFRGWCVRVTPEGKMIPTTSGVRSPGGIGFNHLGEVFYTDNQGPWNGTSGFKILIPGHFVGHPVGNKWYKDAPNMGPQIVSPNDKSRFHVEAARIKEFDPPVSLLPHGKVGNSASGIECDRSDGKFGPFKHHMFVADQSASNITRVVLDKVNGRYNSVAIPFRSGFASGIVPMMQAADGSLLVGGTNRGWGSRGPKPFSFERLVWTGKVPFEVFDMKVTPDGFDLTFTEPVDKAVAANPASYSMDTWTYIYRAEYGSPEVDQSKATITSAVVSQDGMKVSLKVDGRKIGNVHELKLDNVKSAKGGSLLHPTAWYTLWNIPK
jgi:hypothetical protein